MRIKRKVIEKGVELRDIQKRVSARSGDRSDIRSKNKVVIWGPKSIFLKIGNGFLNLLSLKGPFGILVKDPTGDNIAKWLIAQALLSGVLGSKKQNKTKGQKKPVEI